MSVRNTFIVFMSGLLLGSFITCPDRIIRRFFDHVDKNEEDEL